MGVIRRGMVVAAAVAGSLVCASSAEAVAADDSPAVGVDAGRAGASGGVSEPDIELGASLAAAAALALGVACVAATRRTQHEPRRERVNW